MTAIEFSEVNERTIAAKQQLIDRLDELEIGASESELFNIAQQRADLQREMDLEIMIRERLAAAAVVVNQPDTAALARLNMLGQLLDQAVSSNSIANADLALVTQLAGAAKGIGSVIQSNLG